MKRNEAAGQRGRWLRRAARLGAGIALAAAAARADVSVVCERLPPGAAKPWAFTKVPGPSRSDAGQKARITVVQNAVDEKGAPAEALNNGVVSAKGNDLAQSVFLSDASADDGAFLMDLGAALPVAQVNTYSWHEHLADDGARAPQVYTVYGRGDTEPKVTDPARDAAWIKIADVDSRPSATGEGWAGQHGVSIRDSAGALLGTYRYLLFRVHATRSPKQSNPVWTQTFFTELDVHTPETAGKPGDARVGGSAHVDQVIVVFKTHFDIGYTDLVTNVLKRYRTSMIDQALDIIDASRALPPEQQFKWTVAGWPLAQILWAGQTPERRERVLRALREGRLVLHALPFTTETESNELEDLARGLRFSAEVARAAGLPMPRAGKMTDVPEHAWAVPTLLTHAGITFLHLGCNGASAYPRVPRLFWWEGPDGSRLLTSYSIDYGTGLVPPANWPYRTWLAMIMTGDNHGPPNAQEVNEVLARAARELPGVKVRFGRLEDFADAILAEKPDLPVVRADMPDTWIHGLMSMPIESQLARRVRPLETALGALDTQLRAAGLAPAPVGPTLADAYEHSLLYGEHTWGLSGGSPGGFWYGDDWRKALAEGKYKRFQQSFDDHRDYIRRTASLVTQGLDDRLGLLAKSVKVDGPRLVVFNPLPWARDAVVEADAPAGVAALRDAETGKAVSAERTPDGKLRFVAAALPAGGYRTYRGASAERTDRTNPTDRTLENRFFRVTLDAARGGIASLIDKQTGRELAAAPGDGVLGGYLHETFDASHVQGFMRAYSRMQGGWAANDFGKPNMPGPDKAPYAALTLTNWAVAVERTPVAETATLRCANAMPMAKAVTLKVTLCADQPYLDLQWGIEEKTPDPLPEGGWLCLPFGIAEPSFRVGRLGAVIDPARDIVAGANRRLLCVSSGLTIAGPDGFGVGLCPIDAPLVSLDEPGLWQYSLDFVPKRARVYVNLYNNQWDTNFPLWQEGTWTSRVRLWVVRGKGMEPELITPAWEARTAALTAWVDGAAGQLPASAAGLSVSRKGVLATSFGPDPYGDGTLLRLWEQAGNGGRCEVMLPAGFAAKSAQPVNLRGEPEGQAIAVRGGVFSVDLPAYAPASFRMIP